MSAIEITVRGQAETFHPPERAVIHGTVVFDGRDRDDVHSWATTRAAAVHESIAALHDPDRGPVTRWSASELATWSRRPWTDDGVQLPLVHHAALSFQATFLDFGRMAAWIDVIAPSPGVAVKEIEWRLTEAREAELTREVRTAAVRDATERARTYALAADRADVVATAIAEPGMLIQGGPGGASGVMADALLASRAPGHEPLRLVPEDVRVSATIEARFQAG